MNNTTFHLMSLLCKSSVSKYMIMAKSVINEIIKKIIILISNYYYEVVVYSFTHLMKWNIYGLLKGICKDSHIIKRNA